MELRGRWGLVTGAGKRIGRWIALALAGRGLNVIVHYHASADAAAATVREIEALGVRALALPGDLGRGDDVARLAREAEAHSGGVDVLVNNASNYLRAPFDELTEAIWDASLDVNLKAPFLLAWHLGRAMRARGRGRIVNLADWAGERPYADYLPYCVSKAGVICLTKALAKALAPAVQVNAVSPGPVLPPEDLTPSEREAIVRATPLRRFGTPEDVARCVRFLVEEADFTTGAVAVAGHEADPEPLAAIRKDLGLDDPVAVQYGRYLARLAHADLGRSYMTGRRVAGTRSAITPATALLAATSLAIGFFFGLAL